MQLYWLGMGNDMLLVLLGANIESLIGRLGHAVVMPLPTGWVRVSANHKSLTMSHLVAKGFV